MSCTTVGSTGMVILETATAASGDICLPTLIWRTIRGGMSVSRATEGAFPEDDPAFGVSTDLPVGVELALLAVVILAGEGSITGVALCAL